MAADDRVRSLLESESSQKGKGRGKGKGKNKTFDRQKLYSLHQDYNGSLSEDQIGQVMLQKKVKSPAGAGEKIKHVESIKQRIETWNGDGTTGTGKKSRQEKSKTQHKRRKARTKERALKRASKRTVTLSKERENEKAKSKKGFTSGESSKEWKSAR